MTARAVELLAYTDMVAAEAYQPHPPRLWRSPLWWAVLAALTTLVLMGASMLYIVRKADEGAESRQRLERIATAQDETLRQISSCVDPGGTCAQRGQRTTGEAVAALNRATVVVVKCADAYDGDAAIDACIARELTDKE